MTNPFDLTGRVAIVTGANTGIGQGIAVALAAAGADVALVGRSSADETAELVRAAGRRAALIPADLSTIAPVGDLVAQTRSTSARRIGILWSIPTSKWSFSFARRRVGTCSRRAAARSSTSPRC